jgi:MFS family permease
VADLAPKRLLGQYNSAFALVKQLALAVGPAVGGLLAATGAYGLYIVMLVGCSIGVSLLALALGRRLTAAQDRPYRSVVVASNSGTGQQTSETGEPARSASEEREAAVAAV